MQSTEEILFQLMEEALKTEHGIYVQTDAVDVLRRRFWAARRKARQAGHSEYEALSFVESPKDKDHLWILRGDNERAGEDND